METLISSKYIDKVVVNTDSEIIKKDLKKHFEDNVIVVNRPQEIIGDFVSMNKIIECDLENVDADLYIQKA